MKHLLILAMSFITGACLAQQIIEEKTELKAEQVKLVLLDSTFNNNGDSIQIVGEIKNVSDKPYKNVLANVAIYDATDKLLDTDKGIADVKPLNPKQTSTFKVFFINPPRGATKYKITFSEFGGDQIPFVHKKEARNLGIP